MKNILLILFLTFVAQLSYTQQFAEFSTDTTRFNQWLSKDNGKLPERISEQEWFINGQRMSYGSGVIKVLVDGNKLDTLLYKGYRRNQFDTIICNISEPKKYTFFYNDCCGAFNIQEDSSNRFIQGEIVYKLKTKKHSSKYLGTLGEIGILINSKSDDTLTVGCRSAMSPNIYNISLQKIKIYKDSTKNTEMICLQEKNSDLPLWDFTYKRIDQKLNFLFMPLKSEPLIIIYDENTDTLEIK